MSSNSGEASTDSPLSLADELTAELQAALPSAATAAATLLRTVGQLQRSIVGLGLTRETSLSNVPPAVCGVVAQSKMRPISAGALYGVLGVGATLSLAGEAPALGSRPWSRCGFLLGGNLSNRLRWVEAGLTYELLSDILTRAERPDVILVDGGLLLHRGQMPTGDVDQAEKAEWQDFLSEANGFWERWASQLYPFNPNGPVIAGVLQRKAPPVFQALIEHRGFRITPDSLTDLARSWLRENTSGITRLGAMPLLQGLLKRGMRSLAFSYGVLDLDERLEPSRLFKHLGLVGFAVSPGGSEVWQVEVPGTASDWTSTKLDEVAAVIAASCLTFRHEVPVPLWYARTRSAFPEPVLNHFERMVRMELRRGEGASE